MVRIRPMLHLYVEIVALIFVIWNYKFIKSYFCNIGVNIELEGYPTEMWIGLDEVEKEINNFPARNLLANIRQDA